MEMPPFFQWLDPYLIWCYRITGHALADFLLGTLAAAVLALLVGEFTSCLASFLVRRRYQEVAGEARKYQDLSMEALKSGDRPAYEAANQVANEAFNKSFFMQVALSATFFWPVFFDPGLDAVPFSGSGVPPALRRLLSGLYRRLHPAVYPGLYPVQANQTTAAPLPPHQGPVG